MTKIESRPIEGRIWEYRFFVDFEGSLADTEVKIALRGLGEEAKNLKILGNYH
jgi:chorismate mutase/prephenate dehydratase